MEQPATQNDIHAQARMKQMHDLIELITGWLAEVQKRDSTTLIKLMKMGAKVQKLLEVTEKVTSTVRAGLTDRAANTKAAAQPVPLPDDNRS